MNESIKNMIARRSVRGYKPDMIPKEDLDLILEAGTYAATWECSHRLLLLLPTRQPVISFPK